MDDSVKLLQEKCKLFIATPTIDGKFEDNFTSSLLDLLYYCTKNEIQATFYKETGCSVITSARNYCVHEFLKSDYTHFLFIDADVGFRPEDALNLIIVQLQNKDKVDVIGAAYPQKKFAWNKIRYIVNRGIDDPYKIYELSGVYNFSAHVPGVDLNGPICVDQIATGFMLIPRETFTKFKEYYTDYDYIYVDRSDKPIDVYFNCEHKRYNTEEHYKNLIETIKNKKDVNEIQSLINKELEEIEKLKKNFERKYVSEDFWFCQKVREAGMFVWLCPWMNLSHKGNHLYIGSLPELKRNSVPYFA